MEVALRGWFPILVGSLASAACGSAFEVGVFGDIPYITGEGERSGKQAAYDRVLASIDEADVAFVVHVGDFAYADQCSDSVYAARRAEFAGVGHPLVYLIGDNEWVDCHRGNNGGYNPLERLDKLREVFFDVPSSIV